LGVESGGIEVRIGEVGQGIEVAVEGMGKGAQGGRFAGADIAGDESGLTFLESKGQTALNFLVAASGEEVLGSNGTAKGGVLKVVIGIERGHRHPPEH
jgi:hypothetical protein